jgi:hypothetical protein
MVDHALLLFIFQQDLGVQLQRALNVEHFELATKIREKRQQVLAPLLEADSFSCPPEARRLHGANSPLTSPALGHCGYCHLPGHCGARTP